MISVYKKLLAYVPEKKFLAFAAIFLSCASAFAVVSSYYVLYLFLQQLLRRGMPLQLGYAKVFAVLQALAVLLYFASAWLSHLLGFRLETNLRKRGIAQLSQADFAFYDTHPSGLVRKLIDDNASQTHQIVAHLIPDQAEALLAPVLVLILSFFIKWYLGVFMLLLSLLTLILYKMMVGEQEFIKEYSRLMEEMSAEMVEYIRGIPVVKIFGTGPGAFKRLYEAIRAYAKAVFNYSLSCRKAFVSFQLVFMAIPAIAIPCMLPFTERLSREDLIVFLIMAFFLTGTLFSSLMKVMYVGMYAKQGEMAVDKLEELFEETAQRRLEFGDETEFANYQIDFEGVSFAYEDENVLEDLSFTLPPGRSYALAGPSGGGKSTIAKLLSGFYQVQSGTIKIGQKPITAYSEQALLDTISFVFQDVRLFKISLYDNVALAKPEASYEEVMTALSQARCDDILDKFPERENTIIGSKGVYLSGGEVQRIAIARALLKDAPIVVFDEATAALDADNEFALQQAFAELMKDKTVIMIAHRLSAIRNLDEILVIDKGKVLERGSDEQLMAYPSLYRQLQINYHLANDWEVQYA